MLRGGSFCTVHKPDFKFRTRSFFFVKRCNCCYFSGVKIDDSELKILRKNFKGKVVRPRKYSNRHFAALVRINCRNFCVESQLRGRSPSILAFGGKFYIFVRLELKSKMQQSTTDLKKTQNGSNS